MEEGKKSTLMLIASADPLIAKHLIEHLHSHHPIIYKCPENVSQIFNPMRVRKIKEHASHLLPHLKNKITHAVLHITTEKDKKFVRDMLPKFRQDRTRLILLLSVRSYQKNYDLVFETKNYEYATYIFYGDLYGHGIPYTYSPVAKILHFALVNKVFTLEGNDLAQIFPIHIVDFLTLVQDLVEENIKGCYFFSFYEKPETVLSLAHYIKRAEPELSLVIRYDSPLRFTDDNRQTLIQDMMRRFMSDIEYQKKHTFGFENSLHKIPRLKFEKGYKNTYERLSFGSLIYYIIVILGLVFFVFDLLLVYIILNHNPNIFLTLKW